MNIQDNGWRDISIWELSVFQFIVQSVCNEVFWLLSLGFSGGSAGKEFAFNVETWVQSLGWEDPLEKGKITHSCILA